MLPIFRQQAYAIDAGYAGDGDYVGHVLEIDVVIGFDVGIRSTRMAKISRSRSRK